MGETVEHVIVETPPETMTEGSEAAEAATDAERAALAAAEAEAAAGATMLAADMAAAQVADAAERTIADYQRDLEQCRAELASVIQSQGEYSRALDSLQASQAAMAERLDQLTPPPPQTEEPPPNPPPDQSEADQGDGDASEQAAQVIAEPAREPEPPARRRAHRWI